jgi:hypothetical protein
MSKRDLRHHADVALAARVERGVVEQHVARGREALAGENVEQGRLAAARLAHDRHRRAPVYRAAHCAQSPHAPRRRLSGEELRQHRRKRGQRRRHRHAEHAKHAELPGRAGVRTGNRRAGATGRRAGWGSGRQKPPSRMRRPCSVTQVCKGSSRASVGHTAPARRSTARAEHTRPLATQHPAHSHHVGKF